MREGRKAVKNALIKSGITPAYAGRTMSAINPCYHAWDHPRLCGKDYKQIEQASTDMGSPPLMREGPSKQLKNQRFVRITPAYAGRTNN